MKKAVLLCLAVWSLNAAAQDDLQPQAVPPQAQEAYGAAQTDAGQQSESRTAAFGLLETVDGRETLNTGVNEFSRMRNDQFCWVAQGFSSLQSYKTVSSFTSPPNAVFVWPGSSVHTNNEKTFHEAGKEMQPDSNGQLQTCWRFDSSDQLGDYTFTLRIGNEVFPPFSFRVIP